MTFVNPRLDLDRQAHRGGDDLAGLARPRVRTGDDEARMEHPRDMARRLRGLLAAQVGQRRIGGGGETALAIALALAVANHYQPAHRKRTAPLS